MRKRDRVFLRWHAYKQALRILVTLDMVLRRMRNGKTKQFKVTSEVDTVREGDRLSYAFFIYDYVEKAIRAAGMRPFDEYRRVAETGDLIVSVRTISLENANLDRFREELAKTRLLVRMHRKELDRLDSQGKKRGSK